MGRKKKSFKVCRFCGKETPGVSKGGGYTRNVCNWCWDARHGRKHIAHKSNVCSRCGFVPEWIGQLDVHHVDWNKDNNSLDNLITLCANCHRLQTHMDTLVKSGISLSLF